MGSVHDYRPSDLIASEARLLLEALACACDESGVAFGDAARRAHDRYGVQSAFGRSRREAFIPDRNVWAILLRELAVNSSGTTAK
jgi:hypothetical protein